MRSRSLGSRQPAAWVPRAVRVAVATAVVASLLLPTGPAHASGTWIDVDVTAAANAPAGDAPFGFSTNLPGEGPLARIVYLTHGREIEELYAGPDRVWHARQLTKSGDADSAPVAYVTTLADKWSPVARIVFGDRSGHIKELSNSGTGGWSVADLTAISGGPLRPTTGHANNIHAFATALPGQPPTAHVLYPADSDLVDLSVSNGGTWHASRVTPISDAVTLGEGGEGFVTQLAGQGPVERIVYGTVAQTLRELSTSGSTWGGADLNVLAAVTLNTVVAPHPYTTNLAGQGQLARVLYVDRASGPSGRAYVGELSVAGGGAWQGHALTPMVGAWSVDDPLSTARGYSTSLAGQGQIARVVYIGLDNHIKELSSSGGPWQLADLTVITTGPPFGGRNIPWDPPMGYMSNLTGQGPTARVVYNTTNGDIHELSVA